MNKIEFDKLIFIFILLTFSYSQNLDSSNNIENSFVIIDSIFIEGNDITKEYIILRELDFEVGDTLSLDQIEFNKERVYSLGIFNFVDFNLLGESQNKELQISVEESWYIFPIPFFKLRENSIDKSSYGMRLSWRNFRGRNEKIRAVVSLGYDPFYTVNYINPLLSYEQEISFQFSFNYSNIANKSIQAENLVGGDFDYDAISTSVAFGKRINNFNEFFLSFSFSEIKSPFENIQLITASGNKNESVFSTGVHYVYDSRNLKQHASDGIHSTFRLSHRGFGINSVNYNIFYMDFKEYRPIIGGLSSKWRILYRHAFGDTVPYYDYSYLGVGEFVRGHSKEDREGLKLIMTSLEFNYPLIKDFDFSFKLPLIPKKLTSARLSIYADVFGDAGITYDNSNEITYSNFSKGYGFGFTFLFLPYQAFRLAYAFNEVRKGELLIGTGFSF